MVTGRQQHSGRSGKLCAENSNAACVSGEQGLAVEEDTLKWRWRWSGGERTRWKAVTVGWTPGLNKGSRAGRETACGVKCRRVVLHGLTHTQP